MSFSYLGFQIVEYAFVNPESPYVKDLSFVAFAASDVTKNCTFYFSTANDEYKNSFKSGCHDLTPSATIPTSTATFEQFKKFDTINIYYNNSFYFQINASTAASLDINILKFFSGNIEGNYNNYGYIPTFTVSNFHQVGGMLVNKPISLFDYQLYIAKFYGDYSESKGTIVDENNAVACNLIFTNFNEAVCRLVGSSLVSSPTKYTLLLKNGNTTMIKYPFTRYYEDIVLTAEKQPFPIPADVATEISSNKIKLAQIIERQIIPINITVVLQKSDSQSVAPLTTTFFVNINDSSAKAGTPSVDDQSCPVVNLVVQSNSVTIYNGSTFGFCLVQVTSSTATLIAWADFLMNATFQDGTSLFTTQIKLTPRMISDWVSNSMSQQITVISLSEINKSGLTNGEIAAIVVGSVAGAILASLFVGIIVKICIQKCIQPDNFVKATGMM